MASVRNFPTIKEVRTYVIGGVGSGKIRREEVAPRPARTLTLAQEAIITM